MMVEYLDQIKGGLMNYIYQQTGWPHFKWDMMALLDPLVKASYHQGILLGRLSALSPSIRGKAELESLTREILATASFEGWNLNHEAVRSALARKLGIDIGETVQPDPLSMGYSTLLLDAVKNAEKPLTTERLFEWHEYIHPTEAGGVRSKITSAWRTAITGVKQVITGHLLYELMSYEPPEASHLSENMQAFIDWYNLPCLSPEAKVSVPPKYALHPMLEAGIAYLWMVAIHPFERRNGLFGQALADSVLSRYADCQGQFYSMSVQVGKNRKLYYSALEQSLKNDLDITPWLHMFIETLDKAFLESLEMFSGIVKKVQNLEIASEFTLNRRQKLILHFMLDGSRQSITTGAYAKKTKCSPDTALRDIRDMVGFGLLERGPAGGRKTTYLLTLGNKDK